MHLLLALALLSQQPDTLRLPDLVTTASRIASAGGASYTSHTTITGAELAERGVTQLIDALRTVPGLVVVQAGSRGAQASIFLRGGESDYVKLLVDGVAINTPGGWFNVANLGVGNIDRIEVVRGPGSVVHGSDAVAGVIQVFTRAGAGPMHSAVQFEAGGEQTRRIDGSVGGSGPAGSVSLSAGSFLTDGLYEFNSGYRHDEASGRIATPTGRPWQAAGTFRVSRSRAEFPTDGNGVPADSNQFTTERQTIAGVEVDRLLGGGMTLQALASYGRTTEGFHNALDYPGDTVGYGFVAASASRVIRSAIDLRLLGVRTGPLAATAGVQLEAERQRRTGSATSNFGGGITTETEAFRADRHTRAVYGELELAAGQGLILAGGGRVDDNSAFGTLGSWRAGLSVEAPAGLQLHGQLGRAFKAPTFSELFADTPFEVGNPGLAPEVALTWEAGVRRSFAGHRVHAGAAWFSQAFDNLIQYVGAAPGEPTYVNIGAANSRGVELELVVVPEGPVEFSLQATRMWTGVTENGGSTSATLAEGEPLIRRPEFSAGAGARWNLAPGSLVRLDLHYLGAREDVDFREFPAARVRLDGRLLADLAVSSALPALGERVEATLRVENLLDTQWQQALGYPGRGRLVFLGVRTGG